MAQLDFLKPINEKATRHINKGLQVLISCSKSEIFLVIECDTISRCTFSFSIPCAI